MNNFVRTANGEYVGVNYSEGDIVKHKMSGKKYIVYRAYFKLNSVFVEDSDGCRKELSALSLEKA